MGVLSGTNNGNQNSNKNGPIGVIANLKKQGLIDLSDTQREVALRKKQEREQAFSDVDTFSGADKPMPITSKPTSQLPPQNTIDNYLTEKLTNNPTLTKGLDFLVNNPVTQKISSFGAGANPLTWNKTVSDFVYGDEMSKGLEEQKQKNPITSSLGELTTSLAPFAKASQVISKIPQLAKLGELGKLGQIGKTVIQEGIAGGVVGAGEGLYRGEGVEGAKNRALEYGIGGATLGGIGSLGKYALPTAGTLIGAGLGGYNEAKDIMDKGESLSNNISNLATSTLQGGAAGLLAGKGLNLLGKGIGKGISSSIDNIQTNSALKNIDNSMGKYTQEGLTTRPNLNISSKPTNITQSINNNFINSKNNSIESTLKPSDGVGNMNLRPMANDSLEVPLNATQSNSPKINANEVNIPKNSFENIKTIDDLPNDVQGLESYVNEMQKKQDSGIKLLDVDLQLFAEAQKRLQALSKFRTNTIERATMFDEYTLKELGHNSFDYEPQKVKQWQEGAINSVANNKQKVMDDIKNANSISGGQQAHEGALIAKELYDNYKATGDISSFKNWMGILAEKTRETARALKGTDSAWEKKSAEGMTIKAIKNTEKATDDILKQNPSIERPFKGDLNEADKTLNSIKKETEKVIDEVIESPNVIENQNIIGNKNTETLGIAKKIKVTETSFPKMLQDKISSSLNPKTPQDLGFIRNMINDLFSEAKENISLPKNIKLPDNSISKLANAYNFRQYAGEIRNKAQDLLKQEFADSPDALKILDDYFNKGFKPPHSQKLLNDVLNKRLGGLNSSTSSMAKVDKPQLSAWVKDWYATGRASREDFIQSIIKETGLTGDEAQSLKNTLDSRLHVATKEKKDKLLEIAMAPKKTGPLKTATTKLSELTNIGLFENNKFTNRISEKVSPIIKQMMRENNINMNDIVRLSQQDKQNALALLKRDVFNNARVDDREIVKLLDVVNKEFSSLTAQKQNQILGNLLKERSGTKPKTMAEKLREKINLGVYGDDVDGLIQDAIKEKYNLPTLADDEVKFITETMDSVKGLDERSEPYLEAMAKVEKLILEKTPASLSQKVGSGGFISMLGNFTSPLTNIGGNTLLAIPELASNPLRRVIDKGISKAFNTGNLTVGKTNFGALAQGGNQGVRSVKRDFLGGRDFKDLKGKSIKEISDIVANPINTDISGTNIGDKFENGTRLAFDNKFGRTLENVVGTAMKAGDVPFNKAYYEDTLQQLMKANNVTEPTEDMLKTAFQVSQERTFKDENLLSTSAVALKNLPKTIQQRIGFKPKAQKGIKGVAAEIPQIIANSIIPFAKTPANLIKRGAEYSPLGIAEGLSKMVANRGVDASGKPLMTMMKQREIVDRLTRGIVGTGMLGAGALAYSNGLITDSRDSNPNTEKLKQQNGILPDALKIGNKTFDLKKLQPFTTPIIAGARLMQGDGEGTLNSVVGGVEGALNQYSDMGMLQSLAKASQLFASSDSSNPPDKQKILLDIATTLPKQYVPSILKKLTYAMDPFERDLSSKDSLQYAINGIVGKLPILSERFPVKTDVYGEPIKSYDGDNSLANTMLNPYLSKTLKNNPISNEALRLNKSNIDGDLKTGVIPKELSNDLGDITLTAEQQNQYQKLMGDKLAVKINGLLNNQAYINMDDERKAQAFSRAIDLSRNEAKDSMLKSLGVNSKLEKRKSEKESADKQRLYNKLNLNKK